jgi:50S ribosomal subunit-associated GTPase HflX
VRFGVMLVGFTNSGKTTTFEVLKHAMTSIKKRVIYLYAGFFRS